MADGKMHPAKSIDRFVIRDAYIYEDQHAARFIEQYGRANRRFLQDLNKPVGKVPLTPPAK